MNYEAYVIGTVYGINPDDFYVQCDDLEPYGIKGGEVRYNSSPKYVDLYQELSLRDGVRVRLGISHENTSSIEPTIDILERVQAYERRTLDRYLDILIKYNRVDRMVPELIQERDQRSATVSTDEEVDLDTILKDDELFIDDPSFINSSDFNVYDKKGNILFSINGENISGRYNKIEFSFPFESDEARTAFLDFCDAVQKLSAVVTPKIEG